MSRISRILLALVFTAFCVAVFWQLLSRFARGPMRSDTAKRRAADSAFFAPHN